MKKLTLVIPAKNESESLPKVLDSLKNIDCKIIVSLKDNDLKTIDSIHNFIRDKKDIMIQSQLDIF